MNSIIKALLVLAIASGLVKLLTEHSSLRELQSERDRLSKEYGYKKHSDETKFYIQRVPTDYEHDFLFRIYSPLTSWKYEVVWGSGGSSSGTRPNVLPGECLLRLRFVFNGSKIEFHRISSSPSGPSSGVGGCSGDVLNRFLQEHWDELDIEVIPDGEYKADQILKFVTVRMPKTLVNDLLNQKGGGRYKSLRGNPIVTYRYGSKEAFQKAEDAKKVDY